MSLYQIIISILGSSWMCEPLLLPGPGMMFFLSNFIVCNVALCLQRIPKQRFSLFTIKDISERENLIFFMSPGNKVQISLPKYQNNTKTTIQFVYYKRNFRGRKLFEKTKFERSKIIPNLNFKTFKTAKCVKQITVIYFAVQIQLCYF